MENLRIKIWTTILKDLKLSFQMTFYESSILEDEI